MNKIAYKDIKGLLSQSRGICGFDAYYLGTISIYDCEKTLGELFQHMANIANEYDEDLRIEEKISKLAERLHNRVSLARPEINLGNKAHIIDYLKQKYQLIIDIKNLSKTELFFLGHFHAIHPSYNIDALIQELDNQRSSADNFSLPESTRVEELLKTLEKEEDEEDIGILYVRKVNDISQRYQIKEEASIHSDDSNISAKYQQQGLTLKDPSFEQFMKDSKDASSLLLQREQRELNSSQSVRFSVKKEVMESDTRVNKNHSFSNANRGTLSMSKTQIQTDQNFLGGARIKMEEEKSETQTLVINPTNFSSSQNLKVSSSTNRTNISTSKHNVGFETPLESYVDSNEDVPLKDSSDTEKRSSIGEDEELTGEKDVNYSQNKNNLESNPDISSHNHTFNFSDSQEMNQPGGAKTNTSFTSFGNESKEQEILSDSNEGQASQNYILPFEIEENGNKDNATSPDTDFEKCVFCDKGCMKFKTGSAKCFELCNHSFHKRCLKKYIEEQEKAGIMLITCPQINCKQQALLADLIDYLDPDYLDRYISYHLNSYIRQHSELVCCPTAGCPYIFEKETDPHFRCPLCDQDYCMSCHSEWHEQGLHKQTQTGSKFKKCPSCNEWNLKEGSSNIIWCNCDSTFCYACGKETDGEACGCLENNDVLPRVQSSLFHKIMNTPDRYTIKKITTSIFDKKQDETNVQQNYDEISFFEENDIDHDKFSFATSLLSIEGQSNSYILEEEISYEIREEDNFNYECDKKNNKIIPIAKVDKNVRDKNPERLMYEAQDEFSYSEDDSPSCSPTLPKQTSPKPKLKEEDKATSTFVFSKPEIGDEEDDQKRAKRWALICTLPKDMIIEKKIKSTEPITSDLIADFLGKTSQLYKGLKELAFHSTDSVDQFTLWCIYKDYKKLGSLLNKTTRKNIQEELRPCVLAFKNWTEAHNILLEKLIARYPEYHHIEVSQDSI